MTQAEEIAYQQGWEHGYDGGSKSDCCYRDVGLREAWEMGFKDGSHQALEKMRYF